MPDAGGAPAAGHNSAIEVPEDQFLAWVARIERKRAAKKAADTEYKTERKAARAAGIRLKELDQAMEIRELSREDAGERVSHLAAYLRYLKAPIGHQFTLQLETAIDDDLSDEAIEGRASGDAFGDGHMVGLKGGDPKDNPFDGNSPAGQKWLEGFHEGAGVLKFAMSMGDGGTIDDGDAPKKTRSRRKA